MIIARKGGKGGGGGASCEGEQCKRIGMIVGIVLGVFVLLLLTLYLVGKYWKRKAAALQLENPPILPENTNDLPPIDPQKDKAELASPMPEKADGTQPVAAATIEGRAGTEGGAVHGANKV